MTSAAARELEANRTLRSLGEHNLRPAKHGPVEALCTGGRTLVDIGCGTGALFAKVGERYDTLVGLDFIAMARSIAPDAQYVRTDLRLGLALSDGIADTVTAIEVIEHITDPILLVREAFRIAKPGASFVVTTPNVRYIRHLTRLAINGRGPRTAARYEDALLWDGGHIHYFTSQDVAELFTGAGFVNVRSQALIQPHGSLQPLRSLFSRCVTNALVREFFSGRLLVTGTKPERE